MQGNRIQNGNSSTERKAAGGDDWSQARKLKHADQ